MGKFEKPLTWILIIGILGYLFMVNCYKTECSTEVKKEIRVEIKVEDENLNIDSIVEDDGKMKEIPFESIHVEKIEYDSTLFDQQIVGDSSDLSDSEMIELRIEEEETTE